MWPGRITACDPLCLRSIKSKDISDNSKHLNPLLGFGSLTAVLYFLLFCFENEIVAITSKGGWSFPIPVAIAMGGFIGKAAHPVLLVKA